MENSYGYVFRSHSEHFSSNPSSRAVFSWILVLSVTVLMAAFTCRQKTLRRDFPLHSALLFFKTTTEREGDD